MASLLFHDLTTFRNTHHPEQAIATYDLGGRPSTTSKCARNVVLGLLGTGISARISAVAAALSSTLHDYRLSLTNHSNRSSRSCSSTAAEGGKARAVPGGS